MNDEIKPDEKLSGQQKINDKVFKPIMEAISETDLTGNATRDCIMGMQVVIGEPDGTGDVDIAVNTVFIGTISAFTEGLIKMAERDNKLKRAILIAADDIRGGGAGQDPTDIVEMFKNMDGVNVIDLSAEGVCNCPRCREKRERNKSNPNVN